MREIVHLQAGQCGNQIGAKVEKNCEENFRYTRSFSSVLGSYFG